MRSPDVHILIDVPAQTLYLKSGRSLVAQYPISTAFLGVGEQKGSHQTPRGQHIIRAKIGEGCALNTVFVGRRATGEIYTPVLAAESPDRDWILTRILWLSGTEPGVNRLGSVDTMQRYIYIHATPDQNPLSIPLSHGCVRMHGRDIMTLFDQVNVGTPVYISESPLEKENS